MIFIILPGRGRRLKRCSGRFGGREIERGLRDPYEFGDHQPMLNDRRLGRQNLASVFEPEPTNGTKSTKPPKTLIMIYASYSRSRDEIFDAVVVTFDDGSIDFLD